MPDVNRDVETYAVESISRAGLWVDFGVRNIVNIRAPGQPDEFRTQTDDRRLGWTELTRTNWIRSMAGTCEPFYSLEHRKLPSPPKRLGAG